MIYFIRLGELGPVKIGWTRDAQSLSNRISTFQTACPTKLILIRTIENAPRYAESWLHAQFSEARLEGEWFSYRELMQSIKLPEIYPNNQIKERRIPIIENTAVEYQISVVLREARIKAGIKQKDVAEAIGVPMWDFNRFENGHRPFSLKWLPKLPEQLRNLAVPFLLDHIARL